LTVGVGALIVVAIATILMILIYVILPKRRNREFFSF
jgi:multisubunit Na+/H+ antiporter MnhB subunit